MIRRLLPDNPGDWGRFETFQARVRLFFGLRLPEMSESGAILQIRHRWITAPLDTGFWLVLDEKDNDIAHLMATIENTFGQPYILFWQIEIDEGHSDLNMIGKVGTEIAEWIETASRILRSKGIPPISHAESRSEIEPKLYQRLFRGTPFNIADKGHVYRWTLKAKEGVDLPAIDLKPWAN